MNLRIGTWRIAKILAQQDHTSLATLIDVLVRCEEMRRFVYKPLPDVAAPIDPGRQVDGKYKKRPKPPAPNPDPPTEETRRAFHERMMDL